MTFHEALVQTLVTTRRKAGLSQAEVARRINEYQSWMARLEGGQRGLKVDELIRLGTAIGFDPPTMLRQAMAQSEE
jgi:transcriptional regulator with XRE-family HTH domain